jgi:hypothetical protein
MHFQRISKNIRMAGPGIAMISRSFVAPAVLATIIAASVPAQAQTASPPESGSAEDLSRAGQMGAAGATAPGAQNVPGAHILDADGNIQGTTDQSGAALRRPNNNRIQGTEEPVPRPTVRNPTGGEGASTAAGALVSIVVGAVASAANAYAQSMLDSNASAVDRALAAYLANAAVTTPVLGPEGGALAGLYGAGSQLVSSGAAYVAPGSDEPSLVARAAVTGIGTAALNGVAAGLAILLGAAETPILLPAIAAGYVLGVVGSAYGSMPASGGDDGDNDPGFYPVMQGVSNPLGNDRWYGGDRQPLEGRLTGPGGPLDGLTLPGPDASVTPGVSASTTVPPGVVPPPTAADIIRGLNDRTQEARNSTSAADRRAQAAENRRWMLIDLLATALRNGDRQTIDRIMAGLTPRQPAGGANPGGGQGNPVGGANPPAPPPGGQGNAGGATNPGRSVSFGPVKSLNAGGPNGPCATGPDPTKGPFFTDKPLTGDVNAGFAPADCPPNPAAANKPAAGQPSPAPKANAAAPQPAPSNQAAAPVNPLPPVLLPAPLIDPPQRLASSAAPSPSPSLMPAPQIDAPRRQAAMQPDDPGQKAFNLANPPPPNIAASPQLTNPQPAPPQAGHKAAPLANPAPAVSLLPPPSLMQIHEIKRKALAQANPAPAVAALPAPQGHKAAALVDQASPTLSTPPRYAPAPAAAAPNVAHTARQGIIRDAPAPSLSSGTRPVAPARSNPPSSQHAPLRQASAPHQAREGIIRDPPGSFGRSGTQRPARSSAATVRHASVQPQASARPQASMRYTPAPARAHAVQSQARMASYTPRPQARAFQSPARMQSHFHAPARMQSARAFAPAHNFRARVAAPAFRGFRR